MGAPVSRRTPGALALALSLVIVAPATAAPGWLAAQPLSAVSARAATPDVALGADGRALVAWAGPDGDPSTAAPVAGELDARMRAAGAGWGAVQNLNAPNASLYIASDPRVVFDAQGSAHAVWGGTDPFRIAVPLAAQAADGAWTADGSLPGGERCSPGARFAGDGAGNLAAVYMSGCVSGPPVTFASLRTAGGAWQELALPIADVGGNPPQLLASQDPAVAMGPNGRIVIVYAGDLDSGIHAVVRPASGADVVGPEQVSASGVNERPAVGVDGAGAAVAVWLHTLGPAVTVQWSVRAAGGGWGAPVAFPGSAAAGSAPQVAVAADGTAVAVWVDDAGAIMSAVRPAGDASWTDPAPLSGPGAGSPRLAIGQDGGAVAAWVAAGGVVQGAVRPAGGSWTAAQDLSSPGSSDPAAAIDPAGNALVVWSRTVGAEQVVESAAYDAEGPRLSDVAVPATAVAGQPTTMRASAFDLWAGVEGTGWNFGDGTGATGATVTHVFAAPGTYRVTVGARDALGNAVSTVRQVTVGAAPPTAQAAVLPPARIASTKLRAVITVRFSRPLHGARVAASARVGKRTLSMGSRRVRGRTARFAATFPASGRYALRLSVKPKARGAKARALSLRWRVSKAGHYEVRVRVAAGRAPRLRALGVPSAG
jgi:PKD domain-containing protein